MQMPEVKNWVSLGNIIQIGAMMVAITMAWANLHSRSNANEEDLRDHEARLRILENYISGTLSRIDERLNSIEKAVK